MKTVQLGYGQFAQDWFVNCVLDGKDNGYFLDVGCGTSDLPADQVPIFAMSNTYGLEKYKDWKGIAIDCDTLYFEIAQKHRNSVVCADLLKTNINSILQERMAPEHMDYLSLDVDAAQRKVFDELDFDRFSFSVITYEHNYSLELQNPESIYKGDKEYSRNKFEKLGYKLLFGNVGISKQECIEDWWVSDEVYQRWSHLPVLEDNCTVEEIIKLFIKDQAKNE